MKYLGISDCDIANGLGIRVVLFASGCPHRCPGCHNPETWDPRIGKEFTQEKLDYLIDLLKRPFIDGLTLSGGDPLFEGNRKTIEKICKEVKEKCPDKNIWLYTGYEYEEIQDLAILNYIDVLVDGRFKLTLRDTSLAFRGSSNQRIIDVKKSKELGTVVVLNLDL